MPHSKPRWKSFANGTGWRRLVGNVFALVASLVVVVFVEVCERLSFFERRHVFALSNDHPRLLHDYVCFELSDVCCGHLFGTGRIKMHAGSARR
jgi:hypothetical protein